MDKDANAEAKIDRTVVHDTPDGWGGEAWWVSCVNKSKGISFNQKTRGVVQQLCERCFAF